MTALFTSRSSFLSKIKESMRVKYEGLVKVDINSETHGRERLDCTFRAFVKREYGKAVDLQPYTAGIQEAFNRTVSAYSRMREEEDGACETAETLKQYLQEHLVCAFGDATGIKWTLGDINVTRSTAPGTRRGSTLSAASTLVDEVVS